MSLKKVNERTTTEIGMAKKTDQVVEDDASKARYAMLRVRFADTVLKAKEKQKLMREKGYNAVAATESRRFKLAAERSRRYKLAAAQTEVKREAARMELEKPGKFAPVEE